MVAIVLRKNFGSDLVAWLLNGVGICTGSSEMKGKANCRLTLTVNTKKANCKIEGQADLGWWAHQQEGEGRAKGKLTLTVGTSIGPLATVMKKGSRSWVAGLYKGK
jgi:hypothetical protein